MRQVEAGEDIDVEQDLTAEEREKALSEISGRQVNMSVNSWRPWWEVPWDQAPPLGADASPLIAPLDSSPQGMALPEVTSLYICALCHCSFNQRL